MRIDQLVCRASDTSYYVTNSFADHHLGKTIQVISFLSAIMQKRGDILDVDRRRKHVSKLQDGKEWKKYRTLPPANAKWPTCLIIAPSSVVGNWEREFETVRSRSIMVVRAWD